MMDKPFNEYFRSTLYWMRKKCMEHDNSESSDSEGDDISEEKDSTLSNTDTGSIICCM